MNKESVREQKDREQAAAVAQALREITTPEFWDSLGERLSLKFKHAAAYMFSKGVEFGATRLVDLVVEDMKNEDANKKILIPPGSTIQVEVGESGGVGGGPKEE